MAKSNQRHTTKDICDFLNKTGFPFEMKMAKLLKQKKWEVEQGQTFIDLEENKKREIDIVAQKNINNILVNLVAECKSSQIDSWIFVVPTGGASRFYMDVKHSPKIPLKERKQSMDHLSILNFKEPLATNFIVSNGDKKSDSTPIFDALNKVVKATLYHAGKQYSEEKRRLYFPIVLFSGPIFSATYKKSLSVTKVNYIQYRFEHESDAYKADKEPTPFEDLFLKVDYFDFVKKAEIHLVKSAFGEFGHQYLVEFISESKLRWYLNRLESEIQKINTEHWKLPQKSGG